VFVNFVIDKIPVTLRERRQGWPSPTRAKTDAGEADLRDRGPGKQQAKSAGDGRAYKSVGSRVLLAFVLWMAEHLGTALTMRGLYC
jgi:hypothetical protein